MRYFRIVLITIIMLLPLCAGAKQFDRTTAAITKPVDISARFLEHNRENNTFTARDGVEMKEGNRYLRAEHVFYDADTEEVIAEGNVLFSDEGDLVECSRLTLNLGTGKGSIEKGHILIKKGNFHISGDEIERVGESTYTVKGGAVTTCDGPNPDWKFSTSQVDVTVEGYARARSAKFKILDQTVFYLPWAIFPVKTERQSGFLLPELALSSRDGVTVKNSYFWAISKDKDATFFLDFLEERGFKPGAEFRYAPREDMKGAWYFSIFDDRKYDHTRYDITGRHQQTLWKDLVFKANGRYVSDIDYLKDMGKHYAERSENLIKSTAYLEKPFPKSLLTVETAYFKNLLVKDNDTTIQYLPFVSFFTEYMPVLRNLFYTDIATNFTNFYRTTGDKFSRFTLEPSLRLPYSISGLNLLASGTLIETGYFTSRAHTHDTDTKWRDTVKLEGDANVQFVRNYKLDYFGIDTMQSLIRPQMKYTYIPSTTFRDVPNIDPYDRIYHRNTVTYSLNHYLNAPSEQGVRELSLLEISQTYGLAEKLDPSYDYQGYGRRFSDIDAKLTIIPRTGFSFSHESVLNTYGEGITSTRHSFQHQIPDIYKVIMTHSYTKDLAHEVFFDIGGQYKYLDARYQIRYSLKDGDWIDTLYQLSYRPKCWGVTVKLTQSKRPRDTSVSLSLDLAGITNP
jgi:LPS-assembly protein